MITREMMFNFHERRDVPFEDKNDQVLAHMEMTKNWMFKINLQIKALSIRHEGKVEDLEEFLKL